MRHGNNKIRLNRTGAHRRAMFANMAKSLFENERIETTVVKAKGLRSYAEKMITLAKKNTLASKRNAVAKLQVAFNPLTTKEARKAKAGDKTGYSKDRLVIEKLFGELRERFAARAGGYTRIIRKGIRVGDNASMCYIELVK